MRLCTWWAIALCAGCLDAPAGDAADGGGGDPGALRAKRIVLHPPSFIASLSEVPIAILRAADPELAASARSDGRDIRFVDESEQPLPHEIEHFDPDTGAMTAWVLVPNVADGIELQLRYGDGFETHWPAEAVWRDYAGVWHLADDPTAVPPQMADSSPTPSPGSVVGNPSPATTDGIAGGALSFDRASRIDLAEQADGHLDFGMTSFSYEAWVWVDPTAELGTYDMPWFKGGPAAAYPGYDMQLGAGSWDVVVNDGTVGAEASFSPEPILGAWVQLVAVVDREAAEVRAYADGVLRDDNTIEGFGSLDADVTGSIGSGPNDDTFLGAIDEVRVRAGVLSADWIALQHANLRAPTDFLEIGDEQLP